ncbi:hypothetical protein ACN28S_13920 [Cystobacter fuscus]
MRRQPSRPPGLTTARGEPAPASSQRWNFSLMRGRRKDMRAGCASRTKGESRCRRWSISPEVSERAGMDSECSRWTGHCWGPMTRAWGPTSREMRAEVTEGLDQLAQSTTTS